MVTSFYLECLHLDRLSRHTRTSCPRLGWTTVRGKVDHIVGHRVRSASSAIVLGDLDAEIHRPFERGEPGDPTQSNAEPASERRRTDRDASLHARICRRKGNKGPAYQPLLAGLNEAARGSAGAPALGFGAAPTPPPLSRQSAWNRHWLSFRTARLPRLQISASATMKGSELMRQSTAISDEDTERGSRLPPSAIDQMYTRFSSPAKGETTITVSAAREISARAERVFNGFM